MNRLLALLLFALLSVTAFAQTDDVATLQSNAKNFVRQGDFSNAIVLLTRAAKQAPKNLEVLKDLSFAYYLQRNYSSALETAKPLVERKDADEQTFQILGMIYKALEERKDCEKMYKLGIKKFPNSGVLYNEYGEMLWTREDNESIKLWEKGIEVDPNFSSNYYNACKYYSYTYDKLWCLIYGEIFVNLESYSKRTPEIKNILVESYKKLFLDLAQSKNTTSKNPFGQACLTVLNDQSTAVSQGISAESLTALRSRFVLEWFDKYATKYPFRLFEYHRQLLKDGLFDAYNQWIFGAAQNLTVFQAWTSTHNDEYTRFINFQKGRIYKLPGGQYYRLLANK